MGCSVAYHLAGLGWTDIVLLEQNQLTSGTTWHAAGLVGQMRPSYNLSKLASYAIELYPRLEAETGQATGFKQNGAITVAQTEGRFTELKRQVSMAMSFGVEAYVIDPGEVAERYPLAHTDDLLGAIWVPKDGQTNPTDTTSALARGARMRGAKVIEGVRVTAIETAGGAVRGVTTVDGRIGCEVVVLCAGMWSRALAADIGVAVPLHAAEHMYIVTEALDAVTADLPVLRDYDGCIYVKEEAGKLLLGGFEPVAKPWGATGIPHDRPFIELDEDWDQFEVLMQAGLKRLPILETAGIRQFLNGPESFTPDNSYMLGEAPGLVNLFVGTGFNSIGIASAAGAGKALSEWIVGGAAPMDLWDIDVRRFQPFQANSRYLRERTVETLGLSYALHWPYRQHETARGVRLTPFHDRLAARGACFGVSAGWERPLWYAADGAEPRHEYSYGSQAWWPRAAEEAKAARHAVALFEQTPFAKFRLEGTDAEAVLQRLCANDVGVAPGWAVYTQLLNERGGIEADLTVTRLDETSFMIVTGSAVGVHDFEWIRRHIPDDARAVLTDVTSGIAVMGVMGPRSRELLAGLTDADLSNRAFPFRAARGIDIGTARVLAIRISYVGELGWELYVPSEQALPLYDALVDAGAGVGLVHAGMHAMDSLRLEKAFKHWGHDISGEDTPLQAGLGFAVAWGKNTPFIGRDALLAQKEEGVRRRLVTFTIEEGTPLMLHDEPILRDGALVGRTTSGNFAFTLGKPISMGYVANAGEVVERDYLTSGSYEIEVAGDRFPATPHLRPPYDPKGERMRG